MPTVDMLVKNCRLVRTGRIVDTNLVIDEGKVKKISGNTINITADQIIDAKNNLVMPGCIDIHVHCREPHGPNTPANQEVFSSATSAAAAGGYTTIFDMPVICYPPTTNLSGLKIKKDLADKECLIDYAFYGGAGFGNIQEIKKLAESEVIAFKIYTREMGPVDEQWRGVTLGRRGVEVFQRVMEEVAKTGSILSIHCEDDTLIGVLASMLKSKGDVGLSAYYKSAPNASEFLEVARSIRLARVSDTRINIAHLSTSEAASMVKNAKTEGLPVYAETCPHYLLLTDKEMVENIGPYGKIYPPLRTEQDRTALWSALNDGTIDFLANDHAPHPEEAKDVGWNNIFEAASGVPGLETALPLMLTQVNAGKLNIFLLVNLMSRNSARAYGIGRRKGGLEVGMDADLVIVDMKRETILREDHMYTKSSARIFDGWQVKGVPILTAVRGQVVMEDGTVLGKPGFGQHVIPERLWGKS